LKLQKQIEEQEQQINEIKTKKTTSSLSSTVPHQEPEQDLRFGHPFYHKRRGERGKIFLIKRIYQIFLFIYICIFDMHISVDMNITEQKNETLKIDKIDMDCDHCLHPDFASPLDSFLSRFCMCIVGPSGSGKTSYLCSLLNKGKRKGKQCGLRNVFSNIFIVSPSQSNNRHLTKNGNIKS
jgi:hypothetical protein